MKNKKRIGSYIKYFVLCLCITLISTIFISDSVQSESIIPLKDKFKSQNIKTMIEFDEKRALESTYDFTLKEYERKGYNPAKDINIILDAESITASSKGDIPISTGIGSSHEPTLVWESEYEWFEWTADIPDDGLYEITLEYYPLPGSSSIVHRSMVIDNIVLFDEMSNLSFPRMWRDQGEPRINNIGDEVRPRQEEVRGWKTIELTDSEGQYAKPFKFYFTKGKHIIRMEYINEPVAFGQMVIRSPKTIKTYDEVKKTYIDKKYTYANEMINFQAEEAAIKKSDPIIRRESDGDPLTEPISDEIRKLNSIGGWRWRMGNQSITWNFTVPENGLYKIGMRIGQWWSLELPSYRQIAIDEKIPFTELEEYAFPYNKTWYMETLHDKDNNPYLFHLTKGEHTITMTVKMGPMGKIIDSLKEDVYLLSNIIRQIVMITGNTPDYNFEYELHKSIPNLIGDFMYLSDSMQKKIDILMSSSYRKPPIVNNLLLIKEQLQEMITNPDSISRKMNDLNNAQTSLGTWLLDLKDQPLSIDYFMISNPDKDLPNINSNFFQKASKTWKNFIRSFAKDYDNIGGISENKEGKTINVWVSRGKEWAEIMREMADEDFTARTGISININVLPGSQIEAGSINALMLAVISGNTPDVASGMSAGSPVEFAIRDSVYNLNKFDDYEEISKRFFPGVMVPFKYNSGNYALPETINFNVIFYRKDILNKLEIGIPQTWDELYENTLPALYQNGLQFYFPQDLSSFLYQYGGNYYSDDFTKSGLDTPEAYKAFKEWTELYTSYGIPIVANFFNRMRTGEVPIGVGGYNNYVMLSVAAPELVGKWGVAFIPGRKNTDGTINRKTGSIEGSATVIMEQSTKKEEAWEFLKWWTSKEVQIRFGMELEALLGAEARWNTANRDAFTELPWKREDLKIIMEQLDTSIAQPVILGGYFTSRHISNAWNSVVLGDMNVRDALEKAVKEINKELKAKREEYGLAD